MITIQASVSKGWLNKTGGFKFNEEYYMEPLFRFEQDRKIDLFVKEYFPQYPVYNMEDNLMQAEFINEKQIIVAGLQPNLILGILLGSKAVYFEDKDCDIAGKPLENCDNINELPPLKSLVSLPLIKEITNQIIQLKKTHPEYTVIPPFFWDASGRATIHGIITTSHKLIGENIYMLMVSDPPLAHSIHQWITDAYLILIKYFSELCSFPVSSIHIGECSCTMLSPEYFKQFVIPYINILGTTYKSVRLHSCGNSDCYIDSFSEIPSLKSLDVGSGTSISKIRSKFGNKISISTFPSPDLLINGSNIDNLHLWIDSLINENQEGDLRISYHIEPGYDLKNCSEIHERLINRYNIKHNRLY